RAQQSEQWETFERPSPPLGVGVFDNLALTRQALAVSSPVGRERLARFRILLSLSPAFTHLYPVDASGAVGA
ncbi:MAG TPA: hypothetical protein VI685_13475, partial [Candidatus Angelobacter sp.]